MQILVKGNAFFPVIKVLTTDPTDMSLKFLK